MRQAVTGLMGDDPSPPPDDGGDATERELRPIINVQAVGDGVVGVLAGFEDVASDETDQLVINYAGPVGAASTEIAIEFAQTWYTEQITQMARAREAEQQAEQQGE